MTFIIRKAAYLIPKPKDRDKVPADVMASLLAGLSSVELIEPAFEEAYGRLDTRAALLAVDWAKAEYRLRLALVPIVVGRVERAAQAEARSLGGALHSAASRRLLKQVNDFIGQLTALFDIANQRAQEFAATLAGQLIREISEDSLAGVRAILARAYRDGRTYEQVARDLRATIGLQARQMVAADNFQQREFARLLAQHPQTSPGQLAEIAFERKTRYADRMLRQRTELIARTELNAANNFGQQELWRQAVEENWLSSESEQRWSAALDSRLCVLCRSLHGKKAKLGQPFHSQYGSIQRPPRHPACRCALVLDNPIPGTNALLEAA